MDAELERIAKERSALRQQLETATRAAAAAGAETSRLTDASAILGALRARLPDAPFAARRALVEQLMRPGGVVFRGESLAITMLVPRPPVVASVDASSCGGAPGSDSPISMRIRAVA